MFSSKLGLGVRFLISFDFERFATDIRVDQWGNTLLALVALVVGLAYPIFLSVPYISLSHRNDSSCTPYRWYYGPKLRAISKTDR